MKKFTFLLALMTITTIAMAQRGQNGYNQGRNGYSQTHHNQVRNGNVGHNSYRGQRNQRVYQGRNGGTAYRGEVRTTRRYSNNRGFNNGYSYNAGQRRTRWEYSDCGRYRFQVVERYDCRPGRWVYTNGCRRWVEPTAVWTCVSRRRYNIGCGW